MRTFSSLSISKRMTPSEKEDRKAKMTGAADKFFSDVQIARKKIFKRYLIWILCFFAGFAWRVVQPFPDWVLMIVCLACGAVLLSSPIRRLQKMRCPYCYYPARVTILPLRHFRCMHCHRSIGERGGKSDGLESGRASHQQGQCDL